MFFAAANFLAAAMQNPIGPSLVLSEKHISDEGICQLFLKSEPSNIGTNDDTLRPTEAKLVVNYWMRHKLPRPNRYGGFYYIDCPIPPPSRFAFPFNCIPDCFFPSGSSIPEAGNFLEPKISDFVRRSLALAETTCHNATKVAASATFEAPGWEDICEVVDCMDNAREEEATDEAKDLCTLCYESMSTGTLFVSQCRHSWHARCIFPWLRKWSTYCPCCRSMIVCGQLNC